jgi:hypothetical protein
MREDVMKIFDNIFTIVFVLVSVTVGETLAASSPVYLGPVAGGVTYTTLANCLSNVSSPGTIIFQKSITESTSVIDGKNIVFQGPAPGAPSTIWTPTYKWTQSSTNNLIIYQNWNAAVINVQNLDLECNNDSIIATSNTSNGAVSFINCRIYKSGTTAGVMISATNSNSPFNFDFQQCELIGNASNAIAVTGVYVAGSNSFTGVY